MASYDELTPESMHQLDASFFRSYGETFDVPHHRLGLSEKDIAQIAFCGVDPDIFPDIDRYIDGQKIGEEAKFMKLELEGEN